MAYRIHIANGNSKVGAIKNISLPPVITCRHNAPCASDGCYALKFYKMYPSCRKAWDENLEYYRNDPMGFFGDLYKAIEYEREFRWFVSGDIPDYDFFISMVALAEALPHCKFLCFTKQYEIVNKFCIRNTVGGNGHNVNPSGRDAIPSNLIILFSGWEGLKPDNPYDFPETQVITPDMETVPDDWKICGGNCMECVCKGVGCWELKDGETIAFHKH